MLKKISKHLTNNQIIAVRMADEDNFMHMIRCEPHGRVPVYLFDITLGMEVAGIDTDTIYVNGFDGEKSARSLLALQKYLDYDAVNGSVSWFDNRVYGNDVVFPKKGIPYIKGFVLKDPSKLYQLSHSDIPDELLDQLALSHRLVQDGTDAALVHHVPSPFGAASGLRGLESILMDMLQEPDFVRDLLEFCLGTSKIVSERVFKDVCPDVCMISGAYDNVDLMGEDGVRQFSMDYVRRTIDFIHEVDTNVCFHPHGELSAHGDILKEYERIGVECLYYGENCDPLKIHDFIPNLSLMGGIDTFTTIVLGDAARVTKDTEDCVRKMKGLNYGFTCSCSVDRGLPLDMIKMMVDTVKRVG